MVIAEIFPKPTVEKVIFQIRYANLFFLESKIGDLQVKIMNEFPESNLLIQRQVIITDAADASRIELDLKNSSDKGATTKVWQFLSEKGYRLNVLPNSLDITSELHKSYDNPKAEHKFRDIIGLVVQSFLEVTKIPVLQRIGLRYIDKCPVPSLDPAVYSEWYNTSLPIDRFTLQDATHLSFSCQVKKGNYGLRFSELFQNEDAVNRLTLDFDAFALNIKSEQYLNITDDLHRVISEEYESTIKEPVYKHMREG